MKRAVASPLSDVARTTTVPSERWYATASEPSTSAPLDLEFLVWASDVAWWADAGELALSRLVTPLADVAGSAPVRLLAPTHRMELSR